MPLDFAIDNERLADLCRRHRIVLLELFGSRARGTARPDSDVDLLATFEPGQTPGLEFVALCDEFEVLFGHKVDVLTRAAVEANENRFFKSYALQAVETLYHAD
jgi:predicted nucleotidyltransferase